MTTKRRVSFLIVYYPGPAKCCDVTGRTGFRLCLQFESELKKVLALPSSVIITLHRQNQALKYFDQIWEIKDGELTIVKS